MSATEGSSPMSLSEDQIAVLIAQMSDTTPSTYDEVMEALGYVTADQPSTIALYPKDFDGKVVIEGLIADYNAQVADEADRVAYTDIIGLLTSSITSIVSTISLILIAFVAISLVVSSIMIAIITYISVLERTKEIGVLRSLGASKGDVSKIFNAETFIVGLASGVSAIVITLLLCIPINAIVQSLLGVENIALLPLEYSIMLIAISVVLTLLAGFIPSRIAARKDPVVALRTE
jgi:ABC-type antimicrobial peptide transport system permease subunit